MHYLILAGACFLCLIAAWVILILILGLIAGYTVDKKQHEMEGRK